MYSIQNEQTSQEHPVSIGLDYAYNALTDNEGKIVKDGDFIRAKH